MVKDFSALRCSSARAVTIQRHRDKEMIVGYRERHHPQPREIRVTFDPSRLSLSWIAQAYGQVVPIIRRTPTRPSRRDYGTAEERQQLFLGGSASSDASSIPGTRGWGVRDKGQSESALG
jgi:hypothetical protein